MKDCGAVMWIIVWILYDPKYFSFVLLLLGGPQKCGTLILSMFLPIIDQFLIFLLAHTAENLQ